MNATVHTGIRKTRALAVFMRDSAVNTLKENGFILTKKVESLAKLKCDPGFRVIGEYLSQNDSQYRVLTRY